MHSYNRQVTLNSRVHSQWSLAQLWLDFWSVGPLGNDPDRP